MLFVAMVKPVGRYRHHMPTVFHSRSRLKIGLVGGSFNPAHGGHIHVALEARQQLGLDQIWWLVTPQNPLKSSLGMAPHEKRLADARKIATPYPFLRVIAPESGLPSNYTYNTLKYIIKTMPLSRLVWVMGADNLDHFARWYRYRDMIRLLPIAVVDRPGYSFKAITTGQQLLGRRTKVTKMRYAIVTGTMNLPTWCFIAGQLNAASATEIRQRTQDRTCQ
jgi:nicotinate (nicotinamide) nucleotide adenylyltransferase